MISKDISFSHRVVCQSWLRKSSMWSKGRLSSKFPLPELCQCSPHPLRHSCKGTPRSSSGSKVVLNCGSSMRVTTRLANSKTCTASVFVGKSMSRIGHKACAQKISEPVIAEGAAFGRSHLAPGSLPQSRNTYIQLFAGFIESLPLPESGRFVCALHL